LIRTATEKSLHLNLMPRNMDVSNVVENKKPPLCKGRWVCEVNSEGLKKSKTIPQSATLTAPFTQGSLWKVASKPYVSQYGCVECCRKQKVSPVSGKVGLRSKLEGVVNSRKNNPSVSYADSSLYTREPLESCI